MNNANITAQQEITANLVINGARVKMNFASASDGQAMEKVKDILASSFSQSVIQDRSTILDKRIRMQP